jgi:glycosyltransferase involved in cell wall biosynthesis
MATLVLELELTAGVVPLVIEPPYNGCRILVRHQHIPLGWIRLSTKKQRNYSVDELMELISKQLGWAVVNQFLLTEKNTVPQITEFAPISVIVCTRNRTHFLSSCLTALVSLSYPVFEIIVVDNAPSNDDTAKLVAGMPVRYVKEERKGLDWARNRGIKEAKYDLLAFTDDDARIDGFWLHAIDKAFKEKQVMAVSGLVAPAELKTAAQHIFELGYGGMGHGFEKKYFTRRQLGNRRLLWASSFGIGANMAFRKKVFHDIGYFDVAFDVGTPTNGGGDVEMFFRLVSRGFTMMYEPSMLVWHTHRESMQALRKQIRDNGCSTGCFLIHVFRQGSIRRLSVIRFLLIEWFWNWNIKNLFRKQKYLPRSLSLFEISGLFKSPFAYWQSQKMEKRIHGGTDNVG